MRWFAPLAVLALVLAGCSSSSTPASVQGPQPLPPATPTGSPGGAGPSNLPGGLPIAQPVRTDPVGPASQAPATGARWLDDGTLELDLPVQVVLVGFPSLTADEMRSALVPWDLTTDTLRSPPVYPADGLVESGAYAWDAQPLSLHVVPQVTWVDAETSTAFLAAIPDSAVDGLRDGNAAETQAFALLQEIGVWASAELPALVLLHGGDSPGYDYAYENGHLEGVRFFGGALPVLVADVAAPEDLWVGEGEGYDVPLADGDAGALEDLVHDAVLFRLGHGNLYPSSLKTCHGLTVVHAVRTTGTTGLFSTIPAEVDAARLKERYESLTGDTVYVDVVTRMLPQDDPALDALARGVSAQPTGEELELIRGWVDRNWDTYYVPHAGCEEYLSLMVFGDMADDAMWGIAMHDVGQRRFSFSQVPEFVRAMDEQGPVGGFLYGGSDPSRSAYDWTNFLVAHESGHLFGLAHPHNTGVEGGSEIPVWGFSPTLTAMSYETADRTTQFGAFDKANWARNRLGYLFEELDAKDLRDAPESQEALRLAGEGKWREAYLAAAPLVQA